jgi:DNA-binding transcriptional LysR family regulator
MSTWAGIEEFFTVAQCHSFTQAARRLGLSASQVSREVARLEDRLGQRLLYRSTRRVSLTEPGERFFAQCRRLLEDRDEALTSVLEESPELRGHLRITCSERFVAPMINRFLLRHPRLRADVLLTNGLVDFSEHAIDLAIRFGRQRDSSLITSKLGSRARHLCALPAYLRARGAPASLEELSQHDCVCGIDDVWVFAVDGEPREFRPHARFGCNSGYAVLDAALGGLGICQLPDFYVEAHLRSGALVELLSQLRPADEDVWAVYPHRRHLPLKVKLAVEHLKHEFLGQR